MERPADPGVKREMSATHERGVWKPCEENTASVEASSLMATNLFRAVLLRPAELGLADY